MVTIYNPILTTVGQTLVLESLAHGTPINLKYFAWGDGGGFNVNPSQSQQNLVNEVYRQNITSLYINSNVAIWLEILTIVPASVGGFYIREVGIFTDNNELFCVAAHPEVYKNVPSEGAVYDFREKLLIEIVNLPEVTINLSASTVYVTQDDLQIHKHNALGFNPTKVMLTGGEEVQGLLPTNMLAEPVILTDGSVAMAGSLNLNNNNIINLNNPSNPQDAMTKGYADGTYAGIAGSSTQLFSASDGTTGNQVVNISQFPSSLTTDGYCTLPNGLIMQWGFNSATISEGSYPITFPQAFPTACLNITGTLSNSIADITSDMILQIVSLSTTGATLFAQHPSGGGSGNPDGFYWFAIGH